MSSFHFNELFTISINLLLSSLCRYYVEPSYYQQTEAPAVYYSYTTTAAPSYYVAPISYSTAAPSYYYYPETYTTAAPIYYSEEPKCVLFSILFILY